MYPRGCPPGLCLYCMCPVCTMAAHLARVSLSLCVWLAGSAMRPVAGIQLRWSSYLGDLRALLQQLRRSEQLTDVVLTNGATSVRCHRVVLAAACQTFHDLLKVRRAQRSHGGALRRPAAPDLTGCTSWV